MILAPDLSMLGALAGRQAGSIAYNVAHTYAVPAILAGLSLVGAAWLLPVAIVWAAHIGADRALGYGLKHPGEFHLTHLGPIGRAKKAETLAYPR